MDSRGLGLVRSLMRIQDFPGLHWSCFFIFCDVSTPVGHCLTRKHRGERENFQISLASKKTRGFRVCPVKRRASAR